MQPERAECRRFDRARARPEFHQLAIFLKVAETRSFAATARQMGCTQPAISQAIARLEDIYGGDLFERRRGAPLSLTPIGEAIAPSARILLHTVDEQMERAAEVAQSRAGTLTFGFSPGLAAGPLRAGMHDGNPLRHRMLCHIRDQRRGDTHQNMLSDPRLATAPAPDPD